MSGDSDRRVEQPARLQRVGVLLGLMVDSPHQLGIELVVGADAARQVPGVHGDVDGQ